MTQAIDIIRAALQRINSYQATDVLSDADASNILETFNDMLDSWSIDHLLTVGSNETIFNWTPNKIQYKVGNPTCTSIGEPTITGTLARGSPTITVTKTPSDLAVGAMLTDTASVIPAGTTVLSFVANTSITMSANATATPAGNDDVTYTIPGDIVMARPLRFSYGFTRINNLDFEFEITMSQDRYLEILYKLQPGPWPVCAWFNPQFPYGLLNIYMAPGLSAEAHLFSDALLQNLTLNQTLILPQGYARALKWCLAREICAEYGFPMSDAIKMNSDQSYRWIKALNAQPAVVSTYDSQLVRGNRPDGGWIISGGYR